MNLSRNAAPKPHVSRFVLDSSAVLALLDEEDGAEQVLAVIAAAYVSSVNMAEVYSKLAERGRDAEQALAAFELGIARIVPFTDELARIAGRLRPQTRQYGLSLGDRACLATAVALKAVVYTADKAWSNVSVDC